VLVRNPRFRQWSAAAQPRGYPNRIVLRLDVPSAPAVTAVERSRADVLLSPAIRLHEIATRYPNLLHTGPQSGTIGLVLNTRAYPFSVTAARQAVNYAIDRRRLIRLIGGSSAGELTCQILPPALPVTSRTAHTRPAPDRAERGPPQIWHGRRVWSRRPAQKAPG
jgi:peptide/nickel transport system substrate-binding protein